MKRATFYWYISLTLLCILAYFLQAHLYLHKDVAIITHTAAMMLKGATYTKDIFEPNPPMIFYLSMPAITLAKLFSISILSAIRIYFIALTFISINCSFFLIKKLFKNSTSLIYLLSCVMIYVLLFLPAQQFAQREHFLLVLILPYLFTTALRLENIKLNSIFAGFIGLMAGIGFSIKPHFLPAFFLIEAYFIYQKRFFLGWIRIESLCIIATILTYVAGIFLFYPDYIYHVLPLWMPYYAAIRHPLLEIVLYPAFLYCLGVIVFYFITQRFNQYKAISSVFLLALVGFLGSYLVPQVAWYYHILPALGVACLLATISFEQIVTKIFSISPKKTDIFLLCGMGCIVYATPLFLSVNYFIIANTYFNSNNSLSRLIQFFKAHQKTTTFDLFAMTHDSTILEFYTPAHYIGSFQILVWEYNQVILKYYPDSTANAYEKNIPSMVNILAQNLGRRKPEFVIIDTPSSVAYLGIKINYIEKYSQYKNFKAAWKAYHYLTTIGQYKIYRRNYNSQKSDSLFYADLTK